MKQNVNYIDHHRAVNYRMSEDTLTSIHISLYNALFLIWNECGFDTELSINRNDVMKLSKIGSANTYTKALKELDEKGYLTYKPSHNPLVGSRINLYRFDKSSDKTTNKSSSKGTDKTSDKTSDTLSKQGNYETTKPLNKETIKISLDPFQENFRIDWLKWTSYKKDEFKQSYKKIETEQIAFNNLVKLSKGNENLAREIIEQSIANQWKGLFELKNKGSSPNQTKQSPLGTHRIGDDFSTPI